MSSAEAAIAYARGNRPRFLRELMDFMRIPSISAQPRFAPEVARCAAWLADHMEKIGLEGIRRIPAKGGPLVYGQWLRKPGLPTVLIYGHYDVQPVDPASKWKTPPFEPRILEGSLHGRGASDDKGQLFTHLSAIESLLKASGALPVNVKCLFEGEEETGSPSLEGFVGRNRLALAADVAVMSDTRMLGPDRPSITYSLRGQLSLELVVSGPARDLHSGNFGGAVHNPLQALCEIIADLHDDKGRVAIPGFYDRVLTPPREERRRMKVDGPGDPQIRGDAGTRADWGEQGYSLYERVTIRPALTINGIGGGYQGTGGKGVIPSQAMAKIGIRLVPNQDPREVERLFRRHIARVTPETVTCSVHSRLSVNPAVVDRRHPALGAAARAYRMAFGRSPVLMRSGGSIPAVGIFQRVLGTPTVLMGYALPTDRIHAPNERFSLHNFHRGMEANIRFLSDIGKQGRRTSRAPRQSRSHGRARAVPQGAPI
jgi:acetylornithine deacetylase/succinyl-diaminopimelate desuccinylase-like protein